MWNTIVSAVQFQINPIYGNESERKKETNKKYRKPICE